MSLRAFPGPQPLLVTVQWAGFFSLIMMPLPISPGVVSQAPGLSTSETSSSEKDSPPLRLLSPVETENRLTQLLWNLGAC